MSRCPRCAGRLEKIDGMRPTGHATDCPYENGAKTWDQVWAIVQNIKFMDRKFRLLDKGDGYLLQLEYYEPDIEDPDGEPILQRSRKWYISPWMTVTEIVETAFTCCTRSMYHVTREHFMYKGKRVYSPHFDIEARLEIADKQKFDKRPEKRMVKNA